MEAEKVQQKDETLEDRPVCIEMPSLHFLVLPFGFLFFLFPS